MKMHVVKSCDPFTVPLDDPNRNVPIDQVYLGILATTTLRECHEEPRAVHTVKSTCLEFMVEGSEANQIAFLTLVIPRTHLSSLFFRRNAVKCCPPSLQELFIKFP